MTLDEVTVTSIDHFVTSREHLDYGAEDGQDQHVASDVDEVVRIVTE